MAARARPYKTTLGHVRLNVHDLPRAIEFYTRLMQLYLVERQANDYAFLSRGGGHHVVALFKADRGSPRAAATGTGVDHIAFEVRGRQAFARAFQALTNAGVHVTTVNNGISWSIYFRDPDGNTLEIFRDTRKEPNGQKLWRGVRKPLGREQVLDREHRHAQRRWARKGGGMDRHGRARGNAHRPAGVRPARGMPRQPGG